LFAGEENRIVDLRDYIVLVARSWIILSVTAAVGLATAGVLILVATPQYQSTTQVVFTAKNAANGRDMAYAGTYVQSRIQTYKDLAKSPTVMSSVIEELDLKESPANLANRTEVEVSQLDTLVEVSVEDPSAKAAARTADEVAAALLGAVSRLETADRPTAETPTIEGVVVGPAEVAASPADPDWRLYLLSGLLAGLLVGLAVVAVRHVLSAGDPTVGDRSPASTVPDAG
jgi:capsular polysaccharide biosynthesis protein